MNFSWPDEFIINDQRNQKKTKHQSHQVSQEFFAAQHELTLPKNSIENCTILDLGSYLGTTAYYCLKNNCRSYLGIELIQDSIDLSKKFISKYIDTTNWSFCKEQIENFVLSTRQNFDIIIAWGVFNTFTNPILILEKLCQIGNIIAIECPIPNLLCDNELNELDYAIVEINPYSCQLQAHTDNPVRFQGSRISIGAIKLIANRYGFNIDVNTYEQLKILYPETYGIESDAKRCMVLLYKDKNIVPQKTFYDIYQ